MRYYEINESLAKRAKESYSFSDYVPGSATAEYKAAVDEVYKLGEKAKAMTSNESKIEKIDNLVDRYARKYADWINKHNSIVASCPSVMITGGSNFPVRKKEKQIAREDAHMEEYKKIEYIKEQIENIAYGKEIIKSGDEDAIEQLQDKIEKLERTQELMKAVNAYYRKHKTVEGCPDISEEMAKTIATNMKNSWRADPKPFESYVLTNNNQNIRSAKARLENLIAAKESGNKEVENEHYKLVENTEIMRIQFLFDGKPEAEVRDVLKSNGFKWSPKNSAWQRQLTNNGKYAAKRVEEQLQKIFA